MIDSKELMIGNWLKDCRNFCDKSLIGRYVEVDSIGYSGINITSGYEGSWECEISEEYLEPIPITPQLLSMIEGFRKVDETEFRYGNLVFQIAVYESKNIVNIFLDGTLISIQEQLHSLQNLIFCLSGNELKVNL